MAAAAGALPDPLLTVSEWADKHRMLSTRSSGEAGKWRTDRTPYLREIMDCLSVTSPWQSVVFMAGAQVGKTETGNNWIGYVIHHVPAPMIAVQPTLALAKRFSRQRIDTLIEETPELKERVQSKRSRDSGNSVLSKEFPGGVLVITGANSAVGLRSMAARFRFLDEVDGMPGDVGGEGDPRELVAARSRTYGSRSKEFLSSTPTIDGLSRIDDAYERSDQRRYFVPCPACGHFQTLVIAQLKWDKGKPRDAWYECIACSARLQNYQKQTMLARGEWRATAPGDGKTAGFHLNSLYSPVGWFSWGDIAEKCEAAGTDPAKLQVFVNTVLGETWKIKGEAPEWRRLYELSLSETYCLGKVPDFGCFLTCGVDVQKDRIEASVYAWGRGRESGLVDKILLEGDTSRDEVWLKLDEVLGRTYENAAGAVFAISRLAIDSGYATHEVYAWGRKHRGTGRVLVIKGMSTGALPLGVPFPADVGGGTGKKIKRGVRVWPISTGILKSETYGWLRLERPTVESGDPFPPGYIHVPPIGEEFFKQLTAEQLVVKIVRGFKKPEWVCTRRNEALDERIYARAAAIHCGIERYTEKHWLALGAIAPIPKPRERPLHLPATSNPSSPAVPHGPAQAASTPLQAIAAQPRRRGNNWLGARGGNWLKG